MNGKIVKQLQTLQRITPRTQWQSSCKELLLSQMASQGMGTSRPGVVAGVQVYMKTIASGAYRYTFGSVLAHPSAIAFALLALLFGGSVAAMGSRDSLPGDALYSVKKTSENIQVALAPADQKAELQMKLVEQRLVELDAISKQPISDEEKASKVDALVSDVTFTLSSAGQHLEDIKSTQEPIRVATVANTISQKAVRAEEALTKTKSTLSVEVKKNTAPKVKEAIAQANSTTSKALAVAIEKTAKIDSPSADVKSNIEQRIKKAEEKVAILNETVKIAIDTKTADVKQVAKATQDSKEATDKLETAKKSLEKNDLKMALMKLDESYQLVIDAEDSADALVRIDDSTDTDPPETSDDTHVDEENTSDNQTEQKTEILDENNQNNNNSTEEPK
ncbi:MAG: DUF5667 domain-containing protein [bacterium]|nr:DUF5667 domain-containing protein [bacterium]